MEWTYNMIISLLYFNSLNIIESVLVNLVHPNITSITSIGSSPCSGQRNIMPTHGQAQLRLLWQEASAMVISKDLKRLESWSPQQHCN